MRTLLLLLAASLPVLGSTVTCTGSDASAIQASLNSGGTTTLIGACGIGSTTLGTAANNTTLTTTTGASITYTGSGFLLNINHNNVTVTNITFNGGGLRTTQSSLFTPQSGITITGNTIQNIAIPSTNNVAILGDGYWSFVTITNNTIRNITSVPAGQITSSTNIENCTPASICSSDQYPCSWAGGIDNCYGSGISNVNGFDNTIVEFNHFDTILGNAMSLKYAWTIGGTPGAFTSASNNSISYNTVVNLHRMLEESGGVNGCPGGCQYGNTTKIINWKVAGNFATYLNPYGNSYGLSIPNNAAAPQIINNTFALTQSGNAGFTFENGNQNELFQGNVASVNSGFVTNWGQQNSSSVQAPGFTQFQQNNIFFGPPGNLANLYYGPEGPNYGGTFTNRFNVNGASCSSCGTSTLATAFITSGSPSVGCTANGASFPAGGNGTWCFYATNQLSIRTVQFFIDGSPTPTVTQEIQDLSSTFTSDARWQYHATIDTTGLSGGSHTITATATDVSGATSSKSQTFTTGSGPGAQFSPTSLNFGSITLGNSSAPQVTTLTNTGTTTLTITGGVTITGAAAGDFSKTTTCGSTLSATPGSNTCTVTVTFTPTALGSRIAFVTITDNAAGSPHEVQLTGGASLCQVGNIVSQCDMPNGPNSLAANGGPWGYNGGSFGTIAIDNTGPSGTFAAHITATAPVAPGSNDEFFEDGLTPAANGTMMQATFSCLATRAQPVNVLGILSVSPFTSFGLAWMPTFPTSYGTYPNCKSPFFKVINGLSAGSARLTFQADNSTTGDQVFITNVNLVPAGSVPASTVSTSSIGFSSQAVGTTQTGTPFTITNDGIANLVVSGVSYSAGNAADFGQTNNCTTITPGSSCTVTPTFTPSNQGVRVSSLVITSNDSSQSPQSIPVQGIGAGGLIAINSVNYVDHSVAQIVFTVDLGVTATSTAVAPSGSSVIITAANTFVAGNHVYFSGFTNETCLNGQTANVLSATGTQYTIDGRGIPTACTYSGADSGIGQLSINLARNRATKLPGSCTSGIGGLLQPMEIGPMYFGGLTFNMDVAGLDPATGWNICVEVSADGGATWITGTGTGVTTTALPSVHPALPIPPATFDASYPADTTNPSLFFQDHSITSSCVGSDVGAAYTAAVNRQATLGTVIYFPAGSICATTGNFNLSLQPKDVNTWHPSDVNTSTGQITLGNSSGLAPTLQVGDGVRFAKSYSTLVTYPASNSCEFAQGLSTGQQFFVASVSTGNVVTLACNDNGKPGATMAFTTQGSDGFQGFYWAPANRTLHKIILQPDTPLNQLPPPGVQITPAWASKMFTIQSQLANLGVIGPAGAVITMGDPDSNREVMISDITVMGAIITTVDSPEAHTSSDPNTWQSMYYAGPQVSNIIMDRDYWHNQPAPNRDNDGIFWNGFKTAIINNAMDNGRYYHPEFSGLVGTKTGAKTASFTSGIENMGSGNISVPSFTITLTGSSSGQAFVGLDMTASNALTVWTPTGITAACSPACVNKTQSGSVTGSCLNSDAWQKNGSGNPSVGEIACLPISSGTISSVIAPQPWASVHATEGIAWIIAGLGPGPYVFSGNFLECAGLCVHYDDGGNVSQIRGDYTHTRNYHLTPFKWMYNPNNLAANPASDGLGAYLRQDGEWKSGRRINFGGNICDGGWSEVEPSAACFLFTSVNGEGITDVSIHDNTVMHGAGMFSMAFVTAGSNYPMTPPVLRYQMKNNLAWDIGNPNFYAGRQVGPPNGWVGEGPNATQDQRIENNSIVGNIGVNPAVMWAFDTNIEGILTRGNILHLNSTNQGVAQDGGEPNFGGCPGLTGVAFAICKFTPAFDWSNNLHIGNGQTPSSVAAAWTGTTNYYQTGSSSLSTVGWSKYVAPSTTPFNGNPNNLNFCLIPASPWKAGSSGVNDHSADVGFDCDALNVAQGYVQLYGVPAKTITSTGASIAYNAPDSGVCWIDVSSTDPNVITSFARTADSGGARARSTAITSLTTKTHYNYRLECSGNAPTSQRSGDFWTR